MVLEGPKGLVCGQCLVSGGSGCEEGSRTQSQVGRISAARRSWFSVVLHLNT